MQKTLFISDIDGTIVDSPDQKIPTQQMRDIVSKISEENHFLIATGRPRTFAQPIISSLGLVDPCIVSGGTTICDPKNGEILWQKSINPDSIVSVVKLLKEFGIEYILVNDYAEDEYLSGGWKFDEKLFSDLASIFFVECVYLTEDQCSQLIPLLKKIPHLCIVETTALRPNLIDIHILAEGTTKYGAVQQVIKMLNAQDMHKIAMGDGANDIDLFEAVDYKIAMGNARDELKKSADIVIGDISNDALSEYLIDWYNQNNFGSE